MSTKVEHVWITGEEYGRECRQLIDAGVPYDAPEFKALMARVRARDDYLYEKYGKPLLNTHYGQWVAISADGRIILRDTASELSWAAAEEFGGGNFSKRKLAEFPGHEIRSCPRTRLFPMLKSF